jgi:MFS transporter, DHA3 family, tetracycline resistance protein
VRSDLITAFLRWALLRAALARGWWLTTALYLVVVADLSPSQLVLIGVFQGVTVVIAEVPAGVLADAVSRRRALVVAHVVMGAGMALTGLVTAFPLVVVSQCLWGLGWAISSGADVAWITDELDRLDLIDRVLVAQGRRDLLGTVVGIVGFGGLASATTLSTAIVAAGVAMIGLGLGIVARWPEVRFTPRDADSRWAESAAAIVRRGVAIARRDRVILLVLAATLLINGGAEGFGRLFERRLVVLGIPTGADPIVWFAAIALLAAALGATTLRYVEAHIEGVGVAKRVYVTACAIGTAGMVLFGHAPNTESAVAGSLLVSGIGLPSVRIAGTIILNRRTTSDTRATLHSLLSQSENVGEIIFGLALAAVAGATSSSVTLIGSAILLACGGIVVSRAGDNPCVVADPIFSAPRLAAIYDEIDDDRSDLDAYVGLVDELGAATILDVGCGTGVFACLLAQRGKDVVGLDPAAASIAIARRRPCGERVRWLVGEASSVPPVRVDLVTMTGNVAQVFVTDSAWLAALRSCRTALRPGGHLLFEVRDPARRAWEQWTRDATLRRIELPGGGVVDTWVEVTSVSLPLVSFRHTFVFETDGAELTSDSMLRFRERGEILQSISRAALHLREVRDAPDRPGLEWVFIVERRTRGT